VNRAAPIKEKRATLFLDAGSHFPPARSVDQPRSVIGLDCERLFVRD
jgi:hypothetical protein